MLDAMNHTFEALRAWNTSDSRIVWGGDDSPTTGEGLSAVSAVLDRYGEIVAGLRAEPPRVEPIFLAAGDDVSAMDWWEGVMEAVVLREDQ